MKHRLPTEADTAELALRFLQLADLDNGAFERLGRYEAALCAAGPPNGLYARALALARISCRPVANAKSFATSGSRQFGCAIGNGDDGPSAVYDLI
jgi:hypothetical protein